MLDYFCIFSKGGAILWTWQLTALRGSPVEALIRTCLLEERSGEQSFTYKPPVGSSYTLKWTLDNVRSFASEEGADCSADLLRAVLHGGKDCVLEHT